MPGTNSGAPLTKWSSRVSSTSGSRSVHETAGRGRHRNEVAAVENALDHAAVEQCVGERRRFGGFGVGEVASAGIHDGLARKELAGRGIGRLFGADQHGRDVAVNASASRRRLKDEWRRSRDDPAGDTDADREADQRNPPLAGSHRLRSGREFASPGDHRLGQALAAQPVENDRGDVEHNEAKDDVEPQFVKVAGLVRGVDADQPEERAGVDAVLVLGDQPQSDLNRNCERTGRGR